MGSEQQGAFKISHFYKCETTSYRKLIDFYTSKYLWSLIFAYLLFVLDEIGYFCCEIDIFGGI
jgi:hypothetical protein